MVDLDHTGRKLGGLVLRERIGGGGHGTVYRTEQRGLGRDAVVKVLRPQPTDSGARERFMREAMLASRFDHPYSVHVYAHGVEEDGLQWIAMELVRGVSLKAWGTMSLAEFVPFFERVATVVHAAHRRGIVHRDLKPSNVMVIDSDGQLLPKLLDFGIAKVFDAPGDGPTGETARAAAATARLRPTAPERTRSDADPGAVPITARGVLGSLPYISPEQWQEPWNVSSAADIYALGCLAYEVLTGRTPFTAETAIEYYHLHLKAEAPPLGEGFPPGVERAIRRALDKSPDARQATALEFAAELRAALRTSPHENLQSAAQEWDEHGRSTGFLWERERIVEIRRSIPPATMNPLECAFVAASERRVRRVSWTIRALAVLAAAGVIVALAVRLAMQARVAEQQALLAEVEAHAAREITEAKVTESELEQGRAAVLHGEPEALAHLSEAYRRDRSPAAAFMLARAMQPRLSEVARLPATYGRMWWATFSPDGSRIATADDRAAQIWDAKTYRLLFTLPHGCEVSQVIYSLDGTRLVTVTRAMVRIWDAATGALIRELGAKRGIGISDFDSAAISPDRHFIAAVDAEGSLTSVWETERGTLVAELEGPAAGFPHLAFGADGWLATTGGKEARVFDPHGWRQVVSIPGPVRSIAVDGQGRLAVGSATGEVVLWDVRTASRLRQLRPFGEPVDAVAFSPDGAIVAAGSRDGALQAWRADSGALRSQLNPRHGRILWVEFDPTAASLLAAHSDGSVVVADVTQGLVVATLEGTRSPVLVARFDAGSRLVAASWDGTARVWESASPYRRFSSPPVDAACSVGLGSRPDGRFVAVSCRESSTRVWDTARDRMLAELPLSRPASANGFITAASAVSSLGDMAAIPQGTATEVYALPGGRLLRTVRHGAGVSAIAFADSGRAMASGALDGSVRVVREDGTELALQASAGVTAIALTPDGRVLAADAERRLRVFAADGTVHAEMPLPVRIMSLVRAASRIVALPSHADEAGPPLLIDLDAARVVAQLEGHVGRVFSARWIPGNRVLTAGTDGTARAWDGTTGRLLQTYRGGPRLLGDATVVSGMVVGGDADGLLRFWDAASGAKLWTLPAHKSLIVGVHAEGADIVTRGFTGEVSRWRLPQSEAVIDSCARHPLCAIVSPP